jgi:nucleotide-binding universal stress UspA family protein
MVRIVVGVDGSSASRAALRLAAEIADRFGATLVAVETWEFTPIGTFATGGPTDLDELQRAAEHRLGRVVHEELGDRAETVEQLAVGDSPVAVLLREGEQADLVVVGSRGLGGFKGLLVGSVSQQVTHHASCPVLVVPAPDDD